MRITRVHRLGAAVLGLAIITWWPRSAPPDAAPQAALPALAALARIELSRGEARWAAVRTAAGWRVEPSGDPLDAGVAAQLAEVLSAPVPLSPVTGPPGDLTRFGVGPGSLRVRLVPSDGEPITFRLGKTLGGRETFLALPSGRVVRAGAGLRRAFDRAPDAWRERALLPDLPASAIRRIERREAGGVGWILARDAADAPWSWIEPSGWRLDPAAADAVLTSLATLRAESFDVPADQAWPVRVVVTRADGGAVTLRVGPSGGATVAVAVGDRRAQVHPSRLLFLDVPAERLRDTRVVPPNLGAIRALRWRAGRQEGRLLAEGDRWVTPDGQAASVAGAALATALPEWRTAGFPAAPAGSPFAAPPFAELWIEAADAPPLHLEIGSPYGEGPARWLRSSDRPTVPLVLPASAVRLLDTLGG